MSTRLVDWMKGVFDRLRRTRSKSEIQDKIRELVNQYERDAEGLTLKESQRIRDLANGLTNALDWVIKDTNDCGWTLHENDRTKPLTKG
jgi:hypothetical protein